MKTLEELKQEMADAQAAYTAARDAYDTNQTVAWDAYAAAWVAYHKKLEEKK